MLVFARPHLLFIRFGLYSMGVVLPSGFESLHPYKWWLGGLLTVFVIVYCACLKRYRLSRLREIERTRLRIARDLHDDIGSSLSSIALMSELLLKEPKLEETTRRKLQIIFAAAIKAAQSMRDLVWTINPQYDKLENLLLRMEEFTSEMLASKQIGFSFQSTKRDQFQSLQMDFRRNLLLIYKEMLHNVVKHSQARHVTISIAKTDGVLILKLADDGVGFDPQAVKNGDGLNNIKTRTAELKGKVKIISENGHGTVATLTVKIP